MNKLYFGDNLEVMRNDIRLESIDLIYLDPPFNSKRAFNTYHKESESQQKAFDDTWRWNESSQLALDEINEKNPDLGSFMDNFLKIYGHCEMMAYLVMMTVRLLDMHRVLKPTGTIFLHCDSTASHYIKLVMDKIFGIKNFRNEIIWNRSDPKGGQLNQFARSTDTILFYSKSDTYTYNQQFTPLNESYIQKMFRYEDDNGKYRKHDLSAPEEGGHFKYTALNGITYNAPKKGWRVSEDTLKQYEKDGLLVYPKKQTQLLTRKRYLDDSKGRPVTSLWHDIRALQSNDKERIGYPTQKPLALLNRILLTATNEGDTILDPFCGCGTAIASAISLDRQWIGIDVANVAIETIIERLKKVHNVQPKKDYEIDGIPFSVEDALSLANYDKYKFEWWTASLLDFYTNKRKGADGGIDGRKSFKVAGKRHLALLSVKGGQCGLNDVRSLCHVVNSNDATLGVLVMIKKPTRKMLQEARSVGTFNGVDRIQLLTVKDLFDGKRLAEGSK